MVSKDWGAEHKIPVNIYEVSIWSKVDYGSIVYNSAKSNITKMIDPIHNSEAPMIIGVFRTSSIDALLTEVNVLSLSLKQTVQTKLYNVNNGIDNNESSVPNYLHRVRNKILERKTCIIYTFLF